MQHIGSYELPSRGAGRARRRAVAASCCSPATRAPTSRAARAARCASEVKQRARRAARRAASPGLSRDASQAAAACSAAPTSSAPSAPRRRDPITDRFLAHLPELRAAVRARSARGVRGRSGGDRHRRDPVLLPRHVRDHGLPHRARAARARARSIVPRMMTELAHRRTGIDIHPGARDRRVVLHRPRHGRRDRRDHADRRARADLPGRHARRADRPARRGAAARPGSAAIRRSRTTW